MIYATACLILLLVSTLLAQEVMPGTLASATLPTSAFESTSVFSATSSSSSDARQPITGQQRMQWAIRGTIGPASLVGGLFSAGSGTLLNLSKSYGTSWGAFGERYEMRLTTRAVSNTMEAGLGAIWGEDPRYSRDPGAPFKNRVGHAVKMAFMAETRKGGLTPAYARLMAFSGSNFLSNTWRPDGDATFSHAAIRTGFKFLGRIGSNTFQEFRPDIQQRLFHGRFARPELLAGR